jgi:hypothetical protein
MCLTCGCNEAHRKMDNNLTWEDIRHIAVEHKTTVDETIPVMARTAAGDRHEHLEEYAQRREPTNG